MSSKRIADLPVKNPIDAMKIPTGGFGDYAVTLKSISEWLVVKYSLATKEELKLVDETLKSLIELKADKTSVYTKTVYYSATVFDSYGSGSPEGVIVAGVGSTYRRTDGGANTTFYVKESGTGNTGWVAK